MTPFSALRSRSLQSERMDDPRLDPESFIGSLRGLRRVNIATGSARILWPELSRAAKDNGRTLRVLDIACGGGDVPLTLARRFAATRTPVEICGCDINPVAVRHAAEQAERIGVPATFFRFDALNDKVPKDYDVIMASLFLHHLCESEAVEFLASASKATKRLLLVHDLVRSRAGLLLAQVGVRALLCNHICRQDGPRSVEGAFTIPEARQLAKDAGLRDASVEPRFPFRFLMKWQRA